MKPSERIWQIAGQRARSAYGAGALNLTVTVSLQDILAYLDEEHEQAELFDNDRPGGEE